MTTGFGRTEDYSRALDRMRHEGIHASHLALLRAHLSAPNHTASWRALASRVGYSNAEAVNLQYGKFARRLARHLHIATAPRGFWLHVVADWGAEPDEKGRTTFKLRPQVVRALRALRWFETPPRLHIVQGGIQNGDKAWLEKAARSGAPARTWVVPKAAQVGDEVVVYVGRFGFFATATITSVPKPRGDWKGRYGAAMAAIRLIEPAISLAAIERRIAGLAWARYPRSITTPGRDVAAAIRRLIAERRRTGMPDLDLKALAAANLDELRRVAVLKSRRSSAAYRTTTLYRARSEAIRLYTLSRANGYCEGCGRLAPFRGASGAPYLEPHHTKRLADNGPDHPARVIALCPNCHRRVHYSEDGLSFNRRLIRKLARMEPD